MHSAHLPAAHAVASVPPGDGVVRVLREDGTFEEGCGPGPADVAPTLFAEIARIYRAMVRVRAVDDQLVALQREGRIASHVGSHGEEAAIVGSAAALRQRDWIFPCYRDLGAALWRGVPLATYVNDLFGNEADRVSGRPTPSDGETRAASFASIASPAGTPIARARGVAWGARLKKDDVAALVSFGEREVSSGEFHNALNFAGVFRAPVVLFCRNSGWAADRVAMSVESMGVAYGVPGVRCDGNDLFAVLRVTREAIARASLGEGPTLIEALISRMPPGARGAADASNAWKRRDPLARVRRCLQSRGLWSDAEQQETEAAALGEIDGAIEAAEKLGPPALSTLFDDVLGAPTPALPEQRAALLAGPRALGLAKP